MEVTWGGLGTAEVSTPPSRDPGLFDQGWEIWHWFLKTVSGVSREECLATISHFKVYLNQQ